MLPQCICHSTLGGGGGGHLSTPTKLLTYLVRGHRTAVIHHCLVSNRGGAEGDIRGVCSIRLRCASGSTPQRMAARDITGSDVIRSLQANNVLSNTRPNQGQYGCYRLSCGYPDLRSLDEFARLDYSGR